MRRKALNLFVMLIPVFWSIGAAGCGKSKRKKHRAEIMAYSPQVLGAFKAKGLEMSKFEEVNPNPYGADVCASGQVEGLAVLICQFESAAKAKGAEKKLLKFVQGALTGLVRTRGDTGLVVADPDKMDPRGKTIVKILKTFESQS